MALNETMLRPQGLQQWSHGQTPGSQAVSWHRHCYCFKSSSLGLLRSPQTQVSSRLLQNVKRAAIASVTEATSECVFITCFDLLNVNNVIIVHPDVSRYPLAPVFRYPGEHAFNLHEYLVTLDKPLGLVLAPDPITGQACFCVSADTGLRYCGHCNAQHAWHAHLPHQQAGCLIKVAGDASVHPS